MQVVILVVAVISGVIMPTVLFMTSRIITRLERIENKQSKHSKVLARLTFGQTALLATQSKHTDELEELADAADQLQLATQTARARLDEHDRYLAARRDAK